MTSSPKYAAAQNGVLNLIASKCLSPGDMLPPERELAKHFDVSLITIRRALSNLEQERIVERKQGRGTFVTATIKDLKRGTIVYLNVSREDIHLPSIGRTTELLDSELSTSGFHLECVFAGQTIDTDVVKVLHRAEGVIATGWITEEWGHVLNALDIPVVVQGEHGLKETSIPVCSYDWHAMSKLVGEALIEQGASKIGLLLGGSDYVPSIDSLSGYRATLEHHGITFAPDNVFYSNADVPLALRTFLAERDFDALLIESGCSAHAFANYLKQPDHPTFGVMSTQSRYHQAYPFIVEGAFRGRLSQETVRLLLHAIEKNKCIASIRLTPYLVS